MTYNLMLAPPLRRPSDVGSVLALALGVTLVPALVFDLVAMLMASSP